MLREPRRRLGALRPVERIALVSVTLTPPFLVLDYRGGFGFWTTTNAFHAFGYGGALLSYTEVIGLTQVLWIAAALAAAFKSGARAGFRSPTVVALTALMLLLVGVTVTRGRLDVFAVHALLTTLVPMIAMCAVLCHPAIRRAVLRRCVLVLAIFTALVVAITLVKDARGSLLAKSSPNDIVNSSFETDVAGWAAFVGAGANAGVVSLDAPATADEGHRVLRVRVANPTTETRFAFAYGPFVDVKPGRRYYVRALVSSPPGAKANVQLAVHLENGRLLEGALRPLGNGIVAPAGTTRILEGIYSAPGDGSVRRIGLAVGRDVPRRRRAVFALDGVVLRPAEAGRGYAAAVVSGPGRTLGDRFDLVLFCCGATYTGAVLAGLVPLLATMRARRFVASGLTVVLGGALLLTQTRGAVIGLAAAGVVLALGLKQFRVQVLAFTAVAVLLFAVASVGR